MLLILCAELEEAKHIKCPNAKIIITGVGLHNILSLPKFILNPQDVIINIGYTGSSYYPIGTVASVYRSERLTPSVIVPEKEQKLTPIISDDIEISHCYTADNFITNEDNDKDILLVDMELYYLSLMFPQIQSLKIVSDNLNLTEHRKSKLDKSWDIVNNILNRISNEQNRII